MTSPPAMDSGRSGRNVAHAAWSQGAPARLLAALGGDGEGARVVGGAVRNALLDEPIGEIDIATTAIPDEVTRRAEAAGFKVIPTGIEHGTVTVVIDGKPFEVTTLRVDVETFGRKAAVRFGRDWKADAQRRDFTMNALSAGADGVIYDYVGGLADLDARRVRFIGDPATRIAEDYLRILRFFRFHAAYGRGPLDPAGVEACMAARDGLEKLSRERVRMELLKLLIAGGAASALAVMSKAGLLLPLLDREPRLADFAGMAALETTLSLPPDAIRRLGALAADAAEDAERLRQRLRLANAEHERLASMADGWQRISPAAGEQAARTLLYQLGPESFIDRVLLAWTRAGAAADDAGWQRLAALPQQWTPPAFPLKAEDFIRRGMAKGPALGAALRAAEEAWIAAGFPAGDGALETIIVDATKNAAR